MERRLAGWRAAGSPAATHRARGWQGPGPADPAGGRRRSFSRGSGRNRLGYLHARGVHRREGKIWRAAATVARALEREPLLRFPALEPVEIHVQAKVEDLGGDSRTRTQELRGSGPGELPEVLREVRRVVVTEIQRTETGARAFGTVAERGVGVLETND